MQCHYDAVNFLAYPHKIHLIARPLGRDMACNLWFDNLIYILFQSAQCCMKYRVILDRVVMALNRSNSNSNDSNDTNRALVNRGKHHTFALLISQIPQCSRQLSHNAPFCNRNAYACALSCYRMVHCGMWNWCIVGFMQQAYCDLCPMTSWPIIFSAALIDRKHSD